MTDAPFEASTPSWDGDDASSFWSCAAVDAAPDPAGELFESLGAPSVAAVTDGVDVGVNKGGCVAMTKARND
jgi:hypothetical protein